MNKKLEDVIVKTIAAFANSHGGSLLVGVGDDGEVLGLCHDYASLGEAERDGFEIHLRNLLNQALGVSFVTTKVRISFPQFAGEDICRVDVEPATEPLLMKVTTKDGPPVEKFYARSGNSSQEIPPSQLKAYWDTRFA